MVSARRATELRGVDEEVEAMHLVLTERSEMNDDDIIKRYSSECLHLRCSSSTNLMFI